MRQRHGPALHGHPFHDALSELNGRPLPRGSVAAVARAARSIELSAIAELGPSSSALDIHKAVLELHFAILRILHDTELSNHAEGDDILQARTLLAAFLLERFGPETMRNIEAALETPNAPCPGCLLQAPRQPDRHPR